MVGPALGEELGPAVGEAPGVPGAVAVGLPVGFGLWDAVVPGAPPCVVEDCPEPEPLGPPLPEIGRAHV